MTEASVRLAGAPAADGDLAGSRPVFVVGMNGSGTSMMLDCLGRHPDLYAVPQETLMMPHIIAQAPRFGDLRIDEAFLSYWQYAIDQMPVLRRIRGGNDPEIPVDWQSYPRTVAGVFEGLFGSLAKVEGKRRWCEKTPDHVQHIEMLSRVFPGAQFVHMIRDGREVACSISRRQKRHPELIIYRWKKLIELGRGDGAKLDGRYTEVRYEELTRDPRTQMERVCEFLHLDFSEKVLQSRMPQSPGRKRLNAGELGSISRNPSKWQGYFDTGSVRRLERISGRTLEALGYPVELSGDSDPNWLQKRYWRAIDFLRLAVNRKTTQPKYNSWVKVLRKAVYSFKEYRTKRH